ncbi:integrin alpha-IIb-like [Ciona intestinalis]
MGRSYNVSTDIDGNGYSDVIIASPASDVVVVLYSRPVVLVTSRLEVEPRVLDVIKCAINTSIPCAKVRICLNGSFADGRPLGRNYSTLEVKLNLDSGSIETTRNRLIFMDDSSSERIFLHKLTHNESCSTYDVQVNVASLSHDTFSQQTDSPIVLKASYDFPASHKSIIMSPVLSPLIPPVAYATCKLETNCTIGLNGNCNSRLQLKYSYSIESSSEPLILEDLNGMLTINVTVINRGPEPAYTATLTADATLQLLKPPTRCMVPAARSNADPSYAVELQYQGSSSGIPNLLQPGDQCGFILDYPLAELARNATDEQLLVGGILTGGVTNSPERVQTFSRPLLYKVDASSQGTSQPNSLFYNRTLGQNFTTSLTDPVLGDRETDIRHVYSVENIRVIRIPIATLVFKWPERTAGGLPLLYLYEFQCTSDASCMCDVMGKVNPLNLPYNTNTSSKANVRLNFLPEENEAESIGTYGDCEDTICEEIRCTVEDLKSFQRINLVAKFKLWIPSLPQRELDSSVFSSISLGVRPPLHPLQLAESKVITRVSAFTAPQAVEEISPLELWPFIASAVGGFVLLLLAVLTLWKCGFFESKYKQKTIEAKGKLAEAAAYTQHVPTDDEQPPKK